MTKAGYTHVLIPKSFHSVLKEKADEKEISIWRYIENLIQTDNSEPMDVSQRLDNKISKSKIKIQKCRDSLAVGRKPGKLVGLSPSGVRISLSASSFS